MVIINYIYNFNELTKTERSDYINGIWFINQILKNTFLSLYLTNDGYVIEDKLNKLTSGIHSAKCDLYKYFIIPEGMYLRLDCDKIYKVIKDYKSLLNGIVTDGKYVYFRIKDFGDVKIGMYTKQVKERSDGYNRNNYKTFTTIFSEDDIEALVDKKIINKQHGPYSMILSHKLFPNLKKCDNNNITIIDYGDDCFVSTFNFTYLASNSSGKKVYSEVNLYHKYKFIKL